MCRFVQLFGILPNAASFLHVSPYATSKAKVMGPKKAKAKAKKSEGEDIPEGKKGRKEGSNDTPPAMAIIMPRAEEWVTLDLKNLLLERHGRITDLILCKRAFTEANELTDEMQTLKDYGIKGAPRGAEPHVIIAIFYDFKPLAHDEPLLLVWNR